MKTILVLLFLAACGGQSAIAIAPAASTTPAPAPVNPPPRPGSNVRVHIVGAHEVSDRELASAVDIDKPEKHPGAANRDVLERDVLVIQAELYDRGYLQCKVDEPSVAIGSDGVIDVTFTIEEGPRFRISKLDVEERDERTGKLVTPLRNPEHTKAGDWFSRKAVMQDLQAIQTTYRDLGYGNADVVPETVLDAKQRAVDMKIVIRRGPIVTFYEVRVDPPDALIAADAAKRNGVIAGARFSETKLGQIKTELATKGVRVEIAVKSVVNKPDAVDVIIEVH